LLNPKANRKEPDRQAGIRKKKDSFREPSMKRGDSLIQKVSPDIEDGNIRSEDLKKKKYASLQADKNYDRGMAYA